MFLKGAWTSYHKLKDKIIKEIRTAHSNYQCQLFEKDNTSKKFSKYQHSYNYVKSLRIDHLGLSTLSLDGS